MYRSVTFARRSSGIMNLAGQCSLRCVSVIDRFELVLRLFWTFRTSENRHSRKHPLVYLHHTSRNSSQSAETRLYLISLSITLIKKFPDNSKIYYLIAFQSTVPFEHPLQTSQKTGQKILWNRKFAFWKRKFFFELITCLHAIDAHIALYFRHFSVYESIRKQNRQDVLKT